MASARNQLVGIYSLVIGVFIFSAQDAIIKALSGDYAVTEAIVIRCLVALPILSAMVHLEGGLRQILSRRSAILALRGLIQLVAYTTYYISLPALPLATAVALYFTGPLFITLLAVIFLGEQVGKRVIAALAVGFAGVLVMTAPGAGSFEPAVLLPLVSAFTYAIAQVLARKVGVSDSASVMTFFQNSIFLIGAGLIASFFHGMGVTSAPHPSLEFLVRPWVVPTVIDFALMATCGVIAAFGSTLLTHAYRTTEANLVTVFEYTGLIWAPTWGLLIFGEALGPRVIAGILLILTAGLIVTLKMPAVAAGKAEPPGS